MATVLDARRSANRWFEPPVCGTKAANCWQRTRRACTCSRRAHGLDKRLAHPSAPMYKKLTPIGDAQSPWTRETHDACSTQPACSCRSSHRAPGRRRAIRGRGPIELVSGAASIVAAARSPAKVGTVVFKADALPPGRGRLGVTLKERRASRWRGTARSGRSFSIRAVGRPAAFALRIVRAHGVRVGTAFLRFAPMPSDSKGYGHRRRARKRLVNRRRRTMTKLRVIRPHDLVADDGSCCCAADARRPGDPGVLASRRVSHVE